jgi:hypothetical protein
MTNEESSPALIPGTLPEGLFPELGCNGQTTQQIYEQVLAVTAVSIATGQRGPQGPAGPAGPSAEIDFDTNTYTLSSGSQNQQVTIPTTRRPSHYIWSMIDPTDSATPAAGPPAIGYFSQISGTSWRVTFTATIPAAGWTLEQTLLST